MTLRERLSAARHWFASCFTTAVTSARNEIDKNDLKQIAAKVVTASVAGGSVWAGFKHALSKPEVLTEVTGAAIIFAFAFIDGVSRFHSGPTTPEPAPKPDVPPVPLPVASEQVQ